MNPPLNRLRPEQKSTTRVLTTASAILHKIQVENKPSLQFNFTGRDHNNFGGSSYVFYGSPTKSIGWEASRRSCNESGDGDLVSIEDRKEWEFLKNKIQNRDDVKYYIGLKKDKESGNWTWLSNGKSVNASQGQFPWAKDEPKENDGDCATMYKNYRSDYGLFDDLPCSNRGEKIGYICEKSVESKEERGMGL